MKTSITYQRIWHIAYPIILGSVAQNLINFTDTAFLGRVSEIALGASALGGIFYLAVIMLGFGFGTGAQIIIARRFGEGNLNKIGSVVDHSFLFLLTIAFFSYLLLQYGSEFILDKIISSKAVLQETIKFLDYRAFGIFFAFMNITFRSFYVGLTRTKVITYTTFVMAAVNIVLDYALIFGNWGFPEMGIEGAALASVIAEASGLLFFIVYTGVFVKFKDYLLFRFRHISFEKMFVILKISVPIMMQSFISLSVWFLFFVFIEKLGETALALSNIIRSVMVILMIPIWGFATASSTLVSYLIGLKREEEVMSLIYKIALLSLGCVVLIVSCGMLFPEFLMEVYTNDIKLIEMGMPVLKVVFGGAIMFSIGFVFFNGVSGTGKTNISLTIELIAVAIYLSYVYALVYYFQVDVIVVWTSEILYGSQMALFSFIYLKTNKWKSAIL